MYIIFVIVCTKVSSGVGNSKAVTLASIRFSLYYYYSIYFSRSSVSQSSAAVVPIGFITEGVGASWRVPVRIRLLAPTSPLTSL